MPEFTTNDGSTRSKMKSHLWMTDSMIEVADNLSKAAKYVASVTDNNLAASSIQHYVKAWDEFKTCQVLMNLMFYLIICEKDFKTLNVDHQAVLDSVTGRYLKVDPTDYESKPIETLEFLLQPYDGFQTMLQAISASRSW